MYAFASIAFGYDYLELTWALGGIYVCTTYYFVFLIFVVFESFSVCLLKMIFVRCLISACLSTGWPALLYTTLSGEVLEYVVVVAPAPILKGLQGAIWVQRQFVSSELPLPQTHHDDGGDHHHPWVHYSRLIRRIVLKTLLWSSH